MSWSSGAARWAGASPWPSRSRFSRTPGSNSMRKRATRHLPIAGRKSRPTSPRSGSRRMKRKPGPARITGGVGLAEAAGADLVIEAVFEDMELKKKVFADLDRFADRGAILASNTSNLDIDEIAAGHQAPRSGHRHALLQPGKHHEASGDCARRQDGCGRAGDGAVGSQGHQQATGRGPGFAMASIANRAFDTYWREAEFLVEEGQPLRYRQDALRFRHVHGAVRRDRSCRPSMLDNSSANASDSSSPKAPGSRQ